MFLKKTAYDLKNIRWFALVPLVVLWVVLPFVSWYMISRFPPELSIGSTLSQTQIFAPVMAALPVIFLLRAYVENDGHEVLYTFRSVRCRGFASILLVFALYAAALTPVFVWFGSIYGPLWYEWFRTLVQAFFFASLAYCLVYLVKSTLAGFLGIILVGSAMLFAASPDTPGGGALHALSVFAVITDLAPRPVEWEKYVVYLGVALLLFVVGSVLNKRYFH